MQSNLFESIVRPSRLAWLVMAACTSCGAPRTTPASPQPAASSFGAPPAGVSSADAGLQSPLCVSGPRALSGDAARLIAADGNRLISYDTASWATTGSAVLPYAVTKFLASKAAPYVAVAEPATATESKHRYGALSVFRGGSLELAQRWDSALLQALGRSDDLSDVDLRTGAREAFWHDAYGFSPDGAFFVVTLRDAASSERIEVRRTADFSKVWDSAVPGRLAWFAVSPAGDRLAVFSRSRELALYDLARGTRVAGWSNLDDENLLGLHTGRPAQHSDSIEFSPDGRWLRWLAKGSMVADTRDGRTKRLPGQCSARRALFTPDGRVLVLGNGDFDYEVCVFDLESGRLRSRFSHQRPRAYLESYPVAVTPDGSLLAIRTLEAEYIHVWRLAGPKLVGTTSDRSDVVTRRDGAVLFVGEREHATMGLASGFSKVTVPSASLIATDPGADHLAFRSSSGLEVRTDVGPAPGVKLLAPTRCSERLPRLELQGRFALSLPEEASFSPPRAPVGFPLQIWDVTTGRALGPFGADCPCGAAR